MRKRAWEVAYVIRPHIRDAVTVQELLGEKAAPKVDLTGCTTAEEVRAAVREAKAETEVDPLGTPEEPATEELIDG